MRLSFRQGIVNHQLTGGQQGFLRVEPNNTVSLVVDTQPTTITFAHGDKNYSYTETRTKLGVWGPLDFSGSSIPTYWLYWDLSLTTGLISYGYTTREPISSASTPINAYRVAGQIWWNSSTATMYYCNGTTWVECARVFAGKLVNGSTFQSMSGQAPLFTGTQVGLHVQCRAGAVAFDESGKPIRTGNGRKLFTTEDIFTTGLPTSASVRLESMLVVGEAMEPLAPYQVVVFNDFDRIVHAEPFSQGVKVLGILEYGLSTEESGWVVTKGVIFNEQWDWDAAGAEANSPVYISNTGDIILTQEIADQKPVGLVIGRQTILFDPAMFTTAAASGGVTDHSQLTGLVDDDHLQYFNQARGDSRYSQIGHEHSLQYDITDASINLPSPGQGLVFNGTSWTNQSVDHGELANLDNDDHPHYFNLTRGDARYSLLNHTHDDRYYTEQEVDTFLSGKSNVGHTHVKANITDFAHTHPITDITDVLLVTTPTNGQLLTYNGTSSKWENKTPVVTTVTIPYDIACNYIGAPTDGDTVLTHAATTKFILKGIGVGNTVVKGYADTPPTTAATFVVYRATLAGSLTSLGTFEWSSGNVITSDVSPDEIFDPADNDVIVVVCQTADNIENFGFTIKANVTT